MMIRTLALGIAGTLAVSGLLAPASASAQAPKKTAESGADIAVQNNRKVPVTVYLDQGDFDLRLGEVGALNTSTLKLPTWLVRDQRDIQIFVHPEDGNDLASTHFTVAPGTHLALTVQVGDYPPWKPSPADTMSAVLSPSDKRTATLTVENPRKQDVTIYVEQGDFDLRLGIVKAGKTRTLKLPPPTSSSASQIQIFVHPARGVDLSSSYLDISPGAHLGLKVPVS